MDLTGKVTQVFAYQEAFAAWGQIDNVWYQIEPGAGADSVANMLVVLTKARGSGDTVRVSINGSNHIYYVYY